MIPNAMRIAGARSIGIVVALPAEARTLDALHTSNIDIVVTGPGPALAAAGAAALIARGAGALLSWGTSGALDAELRAGTLVLAESVRDEKGCIYPSDEAWLRHVEVVLAGLQPARATCATSALPVGGVEEKHMLARASGCGAVDMEAAAVASTAAAHALPFLAIRSIVDPVDCELPHCVLASLDPSGKPRLGALLSTLLRRPWELGGLLRLALHFNTALRRLRQAARLLSNATQPGTEINR
jgi:adenosylhomocysteine nucleosidase